MKAIKQTISFKGRPYDHRGMVANRYGVTTLTVSHWETEGKIPRGIRVGRNICFDRDGVEQAIMEG